ncbi:MAG TPA: hypothetical protein VFS59_13450 [Gemmatimonadaceae bacterium]|nr:hypothetical protein [Gemmatimonadaceae bacterium]
MTHRIHRHRIRDGLTVLLFLASLGCDGERGSRTTDSAAATAVVPGIVDSVFPPEEAMRRFREGVPAVSALENAAPSRDSLVRSFVRALERRDTAAVRTMVMTRAEFAYLYYPTSPHARPPAQQPPALVWFLHLENSEKGVGRALDRFGGQRIRLRGYTCATPPRVEGANTIWDDCPLRIGAGGDTATVRLFAGVIERAGRFKILSYANDL